MVLNSFGLFTQTGAVWFFMFYNYIMDKIPLNNKKLLKELNTDLKILQAKLADANKLEGKDPNIEVKVKKNQGRFERIIQKGAEDRAVGKFYIEIYINTKQQAVFIPLSIASGKKVAGFMYQIEGTGEGKIATTDIICRGEGVTQVTIGTLLYAKIPAQGKASFQIRATIRGKFGKVYKIVFTRLNYKLSLTEARYEQYLKEIASNSVKFG